MAVDVSEELHQFSYGFPSSYHRIPECCPALKAREFNCGLVKENKRRGQHDDCICPIT